MNNQNKVIKVLFCSMFMVFIAISVVYSEYDMNAKEYIAPTRLNQIVRSPMDKLFQWPVPSILNGPNKIDSNAIEVAWPKRQCLEWINKVLAPSWLPNNAPELIFIKDEFDQRDVVHASWNVNDYKVEVSQTASIFALKVTPLGNRNTGMERADKIERAKRICLEIFNKTGYRWSADGDKVPVKGLNQKIAAYSFRTESVKYIKDDQSVWGTPQTMHEAGITNPKDDKERRRQMDPNYPDWDNSARSFDYWFRMVTWWNDGNSVGFYFLKAEAGSWGPSYDANFDKDFFKIRD